MFGQVWPIHVDLKFLELVGRELILGKVKTFLLILCFHACKEKMTLLEVDLDELFAFDIDEMWNIIDLLA